MNGSLQVKQNQLLSIQNYFVTIENTKLKAAEIQTEM